MGLQDAIENSIGDNKKVETKQWIQELLNVDSLLLDTCIQRKIKLDW